ncbi:MAG: DNA methyltransferase [Candidatus Acidiferrales bacterium]
MNLIPIHPFPARMAPEIVFEELEGLKSNRIVLDPMSGSGTVLRAAAELGHRALGFDMDPLAVLMARVWTTPFQTARLAKAADSLVRSATVLRDERLPWIDDCEETTAYISYWFCDKQIRALRRLSCVLAGTSGILADAMRIALSRIIVTKERGASTARDTSHSRPHRVFFENDYDVYKGFLKSVSRLAMRLAPQRIQGSAAVENGDARDLSQLSAESVDAVITSPPYLNAIDYLRGHRLSLVWLGYSIGELRALRSRSIGAEKGAPPTLSPFAEHWLLRKAGPVEDLPARELGMVRRYAHDVYGLLRELARVVKKNARVLLVVGNSCLKGVPVWNAQINVAAADMVGFRTGDCSERALPAAHRYLPLSADKSGALGRRMRTETLLSFSI